MLTVCIRKMSVADLRTRGAGCLKLKKIFRLCKNQIYNGFAQLALNKNSESEHIANFQKPIHTKDALLHK